MAGLVDLNDSRRCDGESHRARQVPLLLRIIVAKDDQLFAGFAAVHREVVGLLATGNDRHTGQFARIAESGCC